MSRTDSDEEVLAGPRLPGWIPWLAGAVVVAVLAGGLIAKLDSSGDPRPKPSAPVTSTPAPTPTRSPAGYPVTVATAPPLRLPDRNPPLDIAAVGNQSWLLQDGELSTFTTDADYTKRTIGRLAGRGEPKLVVDAARHRLWVVVLDRAGAAISAYDSETLVPLAPVHWMPTVNSAAALDGALFVSTAAGVYRLLPGAIDPHRLPGTSGLDGQLAADANRGRVLLLQFGAPAHVVVIKSGGAVSNSALPAGVVTGSLAVTGSGSIWLGGFGSNGALLDRLDPSARSVQRSSPLADRLTPGAIIVAAGTDDLLVESGDGSSLLYCVSGTDGHDEQQWPLPAQSTALSHQGGYAIDGDDVLPLELHGGCTG